MLIILKFYPKCATYFSGESIATPEISNFKESVSLVKVINENPPAKEVDETIEGIFFISPMYIIHL